MHGYGTIDPLTDLFIARNVALWDGSFNHRYLFVPLQSFEKIYCVSSISKR